MRIVPLGHMQIEITLVPLVIKPFVNFLGQTINISCLTL